MKPLLRLFAVGTLLLTAVSSFAAGAFQGKVTQTITDGKGRSHDLNYSIKGSKMRMEVNEQGHQAVIISDMDKLETLILMAEQKMYMVMSIKKPVEQAVAKSSGNANVDIQVTGKTDTILGYKCNQVIITDKSSGAVTETWLAEGLGTFMGLSGGGGGGPFGGKSAKAAAWEEALKGKVGFPLRVIGHDAKGKDTVKMETTKLEPGSLPDSLFTPPADYRKFEMPNLGNLFNKGG